MDVPYSGCEGRLCTRKIQYKMCWRPVPPELSSCCCFLVFFMVSTNSCAFTPPLWTGVDFTKLLTSGRGDFLPLVRTVRNKMISPDGAISIAIHLCPEVTHCRPRRLQCLLVTSFTVLSNSYSVLANEI